jgi:predicted Fe-Mo cluster-binding NifX family protein
MKIAIVTDDGLSVSPHFGRARMYAIVTVESGLIVARELLDRSTPHTRSAGPHEDAPTTGAHGTDPVAHGKHLEMLAPIADCAAIIAGGMGKGAYDHASAAGIRPIVTSLRDVDEAAIECAAGRLADEVELLH